MLTDRQRKFANEYIDHGGNGTAAALAAGYSPTTAAKRASKNLRVPEVAEIINAHREAIMADMDGFDVTAELKSLYRRAVAGGALAVASNTLATLARVTGSEAPTKIDYRNMTPEQIDKEIGHYIDIIGADNLRKLNAV